MDDFGALTYDESSFASRVMADMILSLGAPADGRR